MWIFTVLNKIYDVYTAAKVFILSEMNDPMFFAAKICLAIVVSSLFWYNIVLPFIEGIKEKRFLRMATDIANAAARICWNNGVTVEQGSSQEHLLYEGEELTIALYDNAEVAIYEGEDLVFLVNDNKLSTFVPGKWSRRTIWQVLMELADRIGDKKFEKEVLDTASRYYK